MRLKLIQHPDTPDDAVTGIEVEASRPGPMLLRVRWIVGGDIDRILFPERKPSGRGADLWKHTCFEAFVAGAGSGPYAELNLSPSGEWDAYEFGDYRQGHQAERPEPPRDVFEDPDDGRYEIEATFDLTGLPVPADKPWRVGVTAVIEEASGTLSYWALGHRPGRPDFHHPDTFTLTLAPEDRP